jgi:hypothetical protein
MKNLKINLIALTLSLSLSAHANDVIVPDYMVGAKITVNTSDGQLYSFKGEEFKVVPRKKSLLLDQDFDKPTQVIVVEVKSVSEKNRVTIHGGFGYDGQNIEVGSSSVEVSERASPVFGISYSRMLNDRYSLTGSVFTNSTVTLGVGVDY